MAYMPWNRVWPGYPWIERDQPVIQWNPLRLPRTDTEVYQDRWI